MLESDLHPDVDQREVVVEDVRAEGLDDHKPARERDGDDKEPRKPGEAKVLHRAGVQPAKFQPRSARGTGFRGSGPMYSDCGRIMRLLAACSST